MEAWHEILHGLNVLPAFSIFCYGAAAGIGACLLSVLADSSIKNRRRKK